jgi:hypothetical protein
MLSLIQSMTIGNIYIIYYIQSPESVVQELDVLVEGVSETMFQGIVFETKNRDDKNLPTEKEIQLFVQKLELFTHSLKRQGHERVMLCPIYFSANGFEPDIEKYLFEHHVLAADMDSWGINS